MSFAQRVKPASTEFFTPEQCWIVELWNDVSDPAVSVARARVEVGVTTQLHLLRCVGERYIILSGRGLARISGRAEEVGPGDVVVIRPGESQQILNVGETDLIFHCICTPRLTEDCYEALE